jgi:aspartyl-tRNA(Asn)/glutamyl-tRNA(Gln) amidotransferase subunit B
MISSGKISGRIAKEVFELMQKKNENPEKIVEAKGLLQQSDPKELEKIIINVISNNKDKVEQYKSGKEKLFGFFVGQVMKLSRGKANPQLVNEILKNKLKSNV